MFLSAFIMNCLPEVRKTLYTAGEDDRKQAEKGLYRRKE